MEQSRNSAPRWFERDEWDGQDSSIPEEPWIPDEMDRLLHPELFEGPDALPLPAPGHRVPADPAPAHPEQASSEVETRRRRTAPRRDGFTPERQEQFLELIRGGASGREAARRIGISPTTAYNLYNSPEGAAFRAAWDEAARVTDIVLEDTAFDRAVNGQEEVVYHQGRRVGVRWRYDNKLLMQLLRARNPLKYAPLSEIEGWLRHRGLPAPADLDGALERLRSAEAEMDRTLPADAPPAIAAPLPSGEREAAAKPLEGEGMEAAAQSTSSTSSESGQSEDPSPASTSSTSPGNGQEPPPPPSCSRSPSPSIRR